MAVQKTKIDASRENAFVKARQAYNAQIAFLATAEVIAAAPEIKADPDKGIEGKPATAERIVHKVSKADFNDNEIVAFRTYSVTAPILASVLAIESDPMVDNDRAVLLARAATNACLADSKRS